MSAVYIYYWKTDDPNANGCGPPRRPLLKGRRCVVEARGALNTILVRFFDTGERVTTHRYAVREVA